MLRIILTFGLLVPLCAGLHAQTSAAYLSVMDYCTPAQAAVDITACAQNAINAAASNNVSYGGRKVFFPAQYSPYVLLGTLTITSSFVSLEGEGKQTSYIQCANAAADCVQIGQSTGMQTRDQGLYNLGIWGSSKSGGAHVHIFNAYRVNIFNVGLEQVCQGVNIETQTNTITVRDSVINPNQGCSQYGVYWHAATDGTTRADTVTLDNVIIDGDNGGTWSGATGIEWDGLADTMVGAHVHVLHMAKGLCANCVATPSSAAVSPQFANFFDLQLEGFTSRALDLSTGFFQEFKCSECDISNLTGSVGKTDTQAINVGASVTGFQLANSRVGNNQQAAISLAGKDAQLANVQIFSSGLAGSGLWPAIDVSASANGTQLNNIVCAEQGSSNFASYCIQLEHGTTNVQISNIDATNVVFSAVNDLGASIVSMSGLQQPPGVTGTVQAEWRDNTSGEMRQTVFNTQVGANVRSSLYLTTGTANAFAARQLLDQNGSPLLIDNLGPGVTNGYQYNGPKYVWQSQSGSRWLGLTNGHLYGLGAAPAVSACGTGSTLSASANDIHGTVTTGTGGTACTLTWATVRTDIPDCTVAPVAGGSVPPSKSSTTALSLSSLAAGAKYTYNCMGQ